MESTGPAARTSARVRSTYGATVDRAQESWPSGRVGTTVREGLESVTGLGWSVAATGVIAWVVGVATGWRELLIIAGACLVALVVGALFTVGGRKYHVTVGLLPQRVVVGGVATGEVTVVNVSHSRPSLPSRLEVPVAGVLLHLSIPALASGDSFQDRFAVPTDRRAVVPVGPGLVVRGDPLGLFRKETRMGLATELFVHPVTVPVAPDGSGMVRDLEGTPTQDRSNSDIAFHTLRDYEPGDDRRHIHWKTTARTGRLMVRQFQDTRRSHLLVLLSSRTQDYASAAEFELAVSIAASLALRSVRDHQSVSVLAGPTELPTETPQRLLDAFSAVELADQSPALRVLAHRASLRFNDASLAVLIGGSGTQTTDVRDADRWLPAGAPRMLLRSSLGSPACFTMSGGIRTLVMGELSQLNTGLSVVSAA